VKQVTCEENPVPFEEIFQDCTAQANAVPQGEFRLSGRVPVVDQGASEIAGYIEDAALAWAGPLPVVIFGDHTRAIKFIDRPFVLGADGCKVLKTRCGLPKFWYYALLAKAIPSAGYSRHFKFLKEAEFAVPSLDAQEQWVRRLDTANCLRRMRRFALEVSEDLLWAVFLEMFGDPFSNPKNWPRARIDEIGDVNTGNTPPRARSEYYGPGTEWVKSDNISPSSIHPAAAAEHLSELGVAQGTVADIGSSLIVCIAGSENSIGNVCLLDRRVAFNQQINAVTPRGRNDPAFVYGLLRAAKPLIQRSTTLAMKRMINKSKLESLLLFEPPLSEQKRFALALPEIKSFLACQAEALRQSEHLFQTLLHEAFGEG